MDNKIKELQQIQKFLKHPKFRKAMYVTIMNDEDIQELKSLYEKLDKKDKELENLLYAIIDRSFVEEPTRQSDIEQSANKLGVIFASMLCAYIKKDSTNLTKTLSDLEYRVPILREERESILSEISTLYDKYSEEYDKQVNNKEMNKIVMELFGKNKGNVEGDMIEWIMKLQKQK